MHRRTKIVATLGPATSTQTAIEKLIQAGAAVFRLNFSHGSADDHRERAAMVRAAALRTCADGSAFLQSDLEGW